LKIYYQRAAKLLNDPSPKSLKERCEQIADLIDRGSRSGVRKWAVAEAVGAAMLDCELKSHRKHDFDLRGHLGGKCVLIDAKSSSTKRGYDDRYVGLTGGKAAKIRAARATPDCVPAYLAFVEGHGIYLHPGIDPAETVLFSTGTGRRGVASPQDAARVINRGAGRLVPFVQLSSKYKKLADLAKITPADLTAIRRRAAATFQGINMAKLRRHLTKQHKAAVEATSEACADLDAAITARAAARKDAVSTARAGVAAMTREQRKAFVKELQAQSKKK
jgi:hypothetical protein